MGYYVSLLDTPTGMGVDPALHWSIQVPVEGDYEVFTHPLNPEWSLHSQHDNQPLCGFWPTHAWGAGEMTVDYHHPRLDQTGLSGAYRIDVGLHDSETMKRLPSRDLTSGLVLDDHLILPTSVHIDDRAT